jgi:MFS family permease
MVHIINLQRLTASGHLYFMPLAISPALNEPMTAASGVLHERGLRPYSQVFAPFLCGMFAFIDLYCTQPLLPLLATVFHASEANVSLTISASTLGVALSAALLAIFAERVNRKRMIVGSMTVLALCTLLAATATSLPALAVWRFLQGLVTPGIFIITIAYVTEEWPALLVPRVMSFYVAGTVFGGVLGAHPGWRDRRPLWLACGVCGARPCGAGWRCFDAVATATGADIARTGRTRIEAVAPAA